MKSNWNLNSQQKSFKIYKRLLETHTHGGGGEREGRKGPLTQDAYVDMLCIKGFGPEHPNIPLASCHGFMLTTKIKIGFIDSNYPHLPVDDLRKSNCDQISDIINI